MLSRLLEQLSSTCFQLNIPSRLFWFRELRCEEGDTSWVLYLVLYLVGDLAGWLELPYVCGPMLSTAESNSRHFSSFTGRAEHQSINYPENVNFI